MRILIVGDYDPGQEPRGPQIEECARLLAREAIARGHSLLTTCHTRVDDVVAESGNQAVVAAGADPQARIVSYHPRTVKPTHGFGNVLKSELEDWWLGTTGLRVPEPIESADAVVLVAGGIETQRAANWARIVRTPLLPISRHGGAAEQNYYEELHDFERNYAGRLDKTDFQNLSQTASKAPDFARTVIALAERVHTSRSVVVIMSFSGDPVLADAYESFKEVCGDLGYDCRRIDDDANVPRILPELTARILRCAFAIVDLSDESSNVYYELGYAEASKTPLIVTAKKGTPLPFDVKDVPVIFWENQRSLKEQLRRKVEEIPRRHRR